MVWLGVVCWAASAAATVDEAQVKPFVRDATAAEKQQGDGLATRMINRLGGRDAYNQLRVLSFEFIVEKDGQTLAKRHHDWDIHAGLSHVVGENEGKKIEAFIRLSDRSGTVWVDGVESSSEAERKKLLEQAYAWWVNDSYWLVSPFKAFDPGVKRSVIDGALRTSFKSVGLTPGDVYLYDLDAQGMLTGWRFRLQSGRLGTFSFVEPVTLEGITFFNTKSSSDFSIKHAPIQARTQPAPKLFGPLAEMGG